jgi:DNA repair protein RadD
VCNVNVLTTGFDAPNIDCVVLLRPTLSPGLYYQMVGRGFRLYPGKGDFLVLDFGGNVLRHGPVDQIRVREPGNRGGPAPVKECPECHAMIATGYARCPFCGFEFPPPERRRHEPQAGTTGLLSAEVKTTPFAVQDVFYTVYTKRGGAESAPKSMRVDYKVGWNKFKSEWVCFEHSGYARARAVAWWRRRSSCPVPESVQRAVDLANNGAVAVTTAVSVRSMAGDPLERIVAYEIDPIPVEDDDGDMPGGDQVLGDLEEPPF